MIAYTSIQYTRSPLRYSVSYAIDPKKTARRREVNGALPGEKQERCVYVSCINCMSGETAAEEFQETRLLFGKRRKTHCYVAIQGFPAGTLDAERAHEIGRRLAEKVWGEDYEVVIATHCDTEAYHNHFVINTISIRDGRIYQRLREDRDYMAEVSDWLCRQYGLRDSDAPRLNRKNYWLYRAEQSGKPTYLKLMRNDIENAVLAADTLKAFFGNLRGMGYELRLYRRNGEMRDDPALSPPGSDRFCCLSTLGQDYTIGKLEARMYGKYTVSDPFPEADREAVRRLREEEEPPYRGAESGLTELYARYRFELGIIDRYQASVRQLPQFLREDLVRLERLDAQTRFLADKGFDSAEELLKHREELEKRHEEIRRKRQRLYPVAERPGDPGAESSRAQILAMNGEMKALRDEMTLCDGILGRSARVREELEKLIAEQTRGKETERSPIRERRAEPER